MLLGVAIRDSGFVLIPVREQRVVAGEHHVEPLVIQPEHVADVTAVLQRRPSARRRAGPGLTRPGQHLLPGHGVRHDHLGHRFAGEALGVETALRTRAPQHPRPVLDVRDDRHAGMLLAHRVLSWTRTDTALTDTASWVAVRELCRGNRCMPLEVAREVRLVIEADRYRHVSGPDAPEQRVAGRLDTPADDVRVGAHAELTSEAADKMRNRTLQRRGSPFEADGMDDVLIQELTELPGDRFLWLPGGAPRCGEAGHDALCDHGEPPFGVEGILAARERAVNADDGGYHLGGRHAGVVDRSTDELSRQEIRTQVELTLPEALGARSGTSVVDEDRTSV